MHFTLSIVHTATLVLQFKLQNYNFSLQKFVITDILTDTGTTAQGAGSITPRAGAGAPTFTVKPYASPQCNPKPISTHTKILYIYRKIDVNS